MKTESLLVIFKIVGHISAGDIFAASILEWGKGEMICLHDQTRTKMAAQLHVLYALGVLVSSDSYRERQTSPIELSLSTTSVETPRFSRRAATDKPH
jgi:hypothetical protein